jgi:hypothetical protein
MNTTTRQKTQLILHGHFYQPPRENPRTGIIGKQPTAAPYENWNERIYADCYGSNIESRYLSGVRKILSISNNFEQISFNFGPTLLSWMEAEHPDTIEQIVDADRRSRERLGHGNAIAQGYNHTILPLCSPEDAKVQISWGLEDFRSRFGREAEGFWLPETAVNPMVIDLLAEFGIKFAILSPWQCKAVETEPGILTDLAGAAPPYDRPFLLSGAGGRTISAFFYNPDLASGISFGHLLRDADNLYSRLLAIRDADGSSLIHTATDGEIYGHHEPFGDMALAALARKVNERDDFVLTNYATFLEDHPATLRAQLHDGEEKKGTSWSCSHGVSRWYKDCGCHTGGDAGWNQKWRTPLRDSLDRLSEKIDGIFRREVGRIFSGQLQPSRLLAEYGKVVSRPTEMGSFLDRLAGLYPFEPKEKSSLAKMLTGMKNKEFSFTSCGWFFNDIGGLEPRQNIAYALRAIELFQGFSEEDLLSPFLDGLEAAQSNRKQDGNGKTIAENELSQLPGEVEAILFFFLNRKIALQQDFRETYGWYSLESFESKEGDACSVTFLDASSLDRFSGTVTEIPQEKAGMSHIFRLLVKNLETGKEMPYSLENNDIPGKMLDDLYLQIDRKICLEKGADLQRNLDNIRNFSMLAKTSPYLSMGTLSLETMGICLGTLKYLLHFGTCENWQANKEPLSLMLDFVMKYGKKPERELVRSLVYRKLDWLAERIERDGIDRKTARTTLEFLDALRSFSIEPDLTAIQNAVYPFLSGTKQFLPDVEKRMQNALSQALNFDIVL